MNFSARDVVSKIGEGVAEALNTSRLFLGVEEDAFKNSDIHPEYVTTVRTRGSFAQGMAVSALSPSASTVAGREIGI